MKWYSHYLKLVCVKRLWNQPAKKNQLIHIYTIQRKIGWRSMLRWPFLSPFCSGTGIVLTTPLAICWHPGLVVFDVHLPTSCRLFPTVSETHELLLDRFICILLLLAGSCSAIAYILVCSISRNTWSRRLIMEEQRGSMNGKKRLEPEGPLLRQDFFHFPSSIKHGNHL